MTGPRSAPVAPAVPCAPEDRNKEAKLALPVLPPGWTRYCDPYVPWGTWPSRVTLVAPEKTWVYTCGGMTPEEAYCAAVIHAMREGIWPSSGTA